jgi:hypothetical protein
MAVMVPASAPRRAMVSPVVDVASVGGLSLVVCLAFILFGTAGYHRAGPLLPYLLTATITWPHFASSYRLLYASRESIITYRKASIYFPLALAAYAAFALVRSPTTAVHIQILNLAAGVYLARHYTGQAWGMMATFSFIDGKPFSDGERQTIRWSLNLIMIWHMVWATALTIGGVAPSLQPLARLADAHVDPLAGVSFLVGLGGLGAMARRLRALPPLRVVIPWLTLYAWYTLLRKDPSSIVIVQISHALQYLIFPLRIERTRVGDTPPGPVSARYAATWLIVLVLISVAAFAGLPRLFQVCYSDSGGVDDLAAAFTSVFVSFVNVHHYFIDSCLYKLRNPAVRRDLFAHLAPAEA